MEVSGIRELSGLGLGVHGDVSAQTSPLHQAQVPCSRRGWLELQNCLLVLLHLGAASQ